MATKKKSVNKSKAIAKLSGSSLTEIRAYAKHKADELATRIAALNDQIEKLETEQEPWIAIASSDDDYE